ncbi:MAG: alpha/beta hydrolase [Anaerolineales bacterium]|nr:alpha/beta hydrolase [Anaerolineales bacterium]
MQNNTNSSTIQRIPFYIEAGRDVLLSWCHLPEKPTNHAVIICPPVGHEFINSYRGLRHLAGGLAEAGLTVFRIEYQGVGDSSGLDTDPDRMRNWLKSIEHAYEFVKQRGVEHISLVGLRMGATLAATLAETLELEALLCWVPVVEGRRYIREMLALQKTGENAGLDVDSSSLEGGGFLITRETMNEITSISLGQINPQKAKHVRLFNSPDMPVPNELIERWSSTLKNFQHTSLPGYADMMSLPHHSRVPLDAIQQITDCLLNISVEKKEISRTPFLALEHHQETRFDCYTYGSSAKESMDAGGGFPVAETICRFSNETLFGIFSQPLLRDGERKPTILLLNAGSVHRIGPNRNYIYITRQLLSMGFRVMRMDFLGLGDSVHPNPAKENDPYLPEALENIRDAIQYLKDTFGVQEIIPMGLCSGAYASFQTALHLDDDSIQEIIPVNPLTFHWREGMSLDASPAEYYMDWGAYRQSMWKKDRWKQLLRGEKNIKHILKTLPMVLELKIIAVFKPLVNRLRRLMGARDVEDLALDLELISKKGVAIRFFISESDPGYQLLIEGAGKTVKKLMEKKVVEVSFIPKANHNFSSHLGRSRLLAQVGQYFSSRYH